MPITYYPTFKNSSGNVGIGTISPGYRLDVKATTTNGSTAFVIRNANDANNFVIYDNGTASAGSDFRAPIFYDSNNTTYYLDAANSGTSLLVAGNVGVGVTSPNGRLTVLGDGSSNNFSGVLRVADSASAKWGAITLPDAQGTTTSANNYYLIGRGGAYTDRVMSFHIPNATDYGSGVQPKFAVYSTGSDLLFSTEASTGTAYFKGSVGIGASGPSALLQVSTGTPTASTSGIQFGDDTSARIFRSSSAVIRVTGAFEAGNGYVYASNYLQTGNNLIYPNGFSATQRLEVGNSANNAWIDGLTIAPGGTVTAYGDFRAPIFYDSNDTAYYVDPNSVSRLSSLRVYSAFDTASSDVYANMRVMRNNATTDGMYIGYGNSGSTSALTRIFGGGATTGELSKYSTYTLEPGSFRSPIFYDSNDTNFYLDPASTSNLNNLTVVGTMTFGTLAYTTGSRRSKNSSNVNIETVTGLVSPSGPTFLEIRGFCPPTMYRTTGDRPAPYGLGFGNGSESGGIMPIGAGDNLQEIMLYGANSGPTTFTFKRQIWEATTQDPDGSNYYGSSVFSINTGTGAVTASTDIRSPIYYDSNNTSYYIDAASTSIVNAFKVYDALYFGDYTTYLSQATPYLKITTANGYGNFGPANSSWFHMTTDRPNFYMGVGLHVNGDFFVYNTQSQLTSTSVRAPIFYDSNDTTYYIDPAGFSLTSSIGIGGLTSSNNVQMYDSYVDASSSYLQSPPLIIRKDSSATGAIDQAPVGLFIYNLNGTNNTWTKLSMGNREAAGAGNTVSIAGLAAQKTAGTANNWATGNLYFWTKAGGTQITNMVAYSTGYVQSDYSFRSPIFYDSNNTSYYIDAASNSRVSQITTDVGTAIYLGNQNVTTSSRIIINWHSDTDYNYLIGKRAGAWTQPLDITFYTGVRYHAHQSYNGHIFYVTGYDSGEAFSIGKGDGHVRVVNNLYTPIVYDSANTSYYVDPASTSVLNTATISTVQTNAIAKQTNGSPITINSGLNASLGLRVYYDMNLYNTLVFTDSSWNSQGRIFGSSSVVTIQAATTTTSFVKYAGYSEEGGSFRAPIFYDSNDTTYYVDPASTSRLVALWVRGSSETAGNIYVGGTAAGDRLNINYDQIWTPNGNLHLQYSGGGNIDMNYGGGFTFSRTSLRAPIFYDYNDTAYYCDPNGNSVLNGLYVNAYYNLVNDFKDIYVYGDVNTYYVVLIQGEYIYSYGRYSVTRGYNWTGPDTWNTATHKGGLTLDWEWSGDTAWGGNDKAIRIIEFNESYSTMVAGLGYPVNGGVIIWLRGGGVNGALYRIRTPIGANSTVTVYDGVTATNHSSSTSFTAANSTVFSTRTDTSNVSAEISARYPVRGAALLYNENNAVLDQGGTSQTKSGILSSSASLRAPIFYDTDNTGYYIDPNGASSINTITSAQYYTTGWFRNNSSGNGLYNESTGQHFYSDSANYWNVASSAGTQGIRFRTGGHNGTVRGYIIADTNNDVGLLNQDGNWRVRVVGGDYLQADGSSIRGQVFYDINNTSYYCDPAGTTYLNYSIFNGLSSADYTRQFAPSGGYFYESGSVTGAIKIRLPANSKTLYPMLSFTCHIYNYNTGTSRTFKIGGHFSSSSWYNPFAYCLSESGSNLNVRWGYEGNYLVVWIGETNTGWSYPCVFITDFQNGYSAINNSWMVGWNISRVTAFDTVTNGPTAAGFFWNQNNDGSGSGLDADLVDGLEVHTARNDNANKIVRTDSNGYIQAGWINTTSGDNGTTAIDRIYASSDAYIRYYTPANFRTVLDVPTRAGSGASGSWGISITGNAATVTNGVYTNTSNTLTGANYFQSNLGTTSGSLSGPPLQAYASGTNAAFMSFHRGGSYAVNMGLDSDNVLRIGGWSASANRWELDMSGNNWVASSFRAPVFYDSNDTNYYFDGASTSRLNLLRTRNTFGERTTVTAASSTTVDTQYNLTELTMSASITTLTLSNIQSSSIVHMWTIVTVGNGTAYSITWPAAIKWPGGTAPTITSTNTKRDIYQFVTYDGGTTIYAIIVGQNL